jgi:hypothetical protein
MRPHLAERKIKAENSHSRADEFIRQCHEEGRVAVRSGAVRQDETITAGTVWAVQTPSNGYFIRRSGELSQLPVHAYRLLQRQETSVNERIGLLSPVENYFRFAPHFEAPLDSVTKRADG